MSSVSIVYTFFKYVFYATLCLKTSSNVLFYATFLVLVVYRKFEIN